MKKKIFFIIPSIAGGGAERVFVNLVNGIDKSLFDVTLIYLTDKGIAYEVARDVRTINLKVKRVRNAPLKIIKLVRKEKPNLIVSTLGHLNMMLLILKFFLPKKTKLIIRQTNIKSLSESENKKNQLVQKGLDKFYTNANKIICQSEFMKKDFIKFTNIEKNVVKIYNPIDIESVLIKADEVIDYNFPKDEKSIFFVGRLDKVKRIPLIIDAFKKYHEKNNQTTLYIIGEGPEKKEIENYIKKINLLDSVKLLGFQENPYKWIANADLFLMASKHEGMPNVLLEAIALEVPTLILKHPGGTGEIMKALDIEDRFVDQLLITEDSFNNYNKEVSLKLFNNFNNINVIKQYEKLFIEVIEEN